MTYVSIGSQLKGILDSISEFNVVYEYEEKELAKYPAATITALSHTDEFNDTAANNRVFTFNIRLYFRTDTEEDAESILRDLTDKVIVAVENDVTLDNTVDFARPTGARWLFQEREVPVRVVEVTIEVVKRVAR